MFFLGVVVGMLLGAIPFLVRPSRTKKSRGKGLGRRLSDVMEEKE